MKNRIDGETVSQFRDRLQREGRWDEFKKEREAVAKKNGIKLRDAKDLIHHKYKPESSTAGANEEDFKDHLPDGTPVVADDIWTGKAKPSIIDEFEWVHENLGRAEVDMKEAPSLAAWRMYYAARYSTVGLADFKALYVKLVVPDKSILKDRQGRRDDGRTLDKLSDMLQFVDKHEQAG